MCSHVVTYRQRCGTHTCTHSHIYTIAQHKSAESISKPSAAVITIWYLRLYASLCTHTFSQIALPPLYCRSHFFPIMHSFSLFHFVFSLLLTLFLLSMMFCPPLFSPLVSLSHTLIGSVLKANESSITRSPEERRVV